MESLIPPEQIDLDHTLSNRAVFNGLLYTPWREALEELERRRTDAKLDEYLKELLPRGIPECMRGKKSMALFRHIATSNYEIHRFLITADALTDLFPLVLEYTDDKFNDRNVGKYFLGKLCFHKGMNKNGQSMWEAIRIIDFNGSNNKPISSIKTLWDEPLVKFHHQLFAAAFPQFAGSASDISAWLHGFGPSAKDYYKPFLSLFLRDAILFENFNAEEKEVPFTKEVILPAFLDIMKDTGKKPLIVTLAPTDIEGDQFWHSHPYKEKELITENMEHR
jgi:hypothetical protein